MKVILTLSSGVRTRLPTPKASTRPSSTALRAPRLLVATLVLPPSTPSTVVSSSRTSRRHRLTDQTQPSSANKVTLAALTQDLPQVSLAPLWGTRLLRALAASAAASSLRRRSGPRHLPARTSTTGSVATNRRARGSAVHWARKFRSSPVIRIQRQTDTIEVCGVCRSMLSFKIPVTFASLLRSLFLS